MCLLLNCETHTHTEVRKSASQIENNRRTFIFKLGRYFLFGLNFKT